MKKEEKFKDLIQKIMISHYDQYQFRNVVNLIYQEIYGNMKKNNIVKLKRNQKSEDQEIDLSMEEIAKVISKLEKKIHNKQNLFIGALTTLIDACYFYAPTCDSANHLILTAHQRVLESRKDDEEDVQ